MKTPSEPQQIGPIRGDQDAVNAILALAVAVNVERWREKFLVDGEELPLIAAVADAISDLQRCARSIRQRQSEEGEPPTPTGEGA